MNAGSSMKPPKAQVKDKGLGAKSWDFGAELAKSVVILKVHQKASTTPILLRAASNVKT